MIRTVIERLPKAVKGDSYFIEVHAERLLLKHWSRGALKEERWLRATALPVGTYEVIDGDVLHLHDPKTLLDELHAAQLIRRASSPEFRKVIQRIARATGGRVSGDAIALKASAKVDLAKLQATFGDEAAVVYYSGRLYFHKRELTVQCADSPLDALLRLGPRDEAVVLFRTIEATCGIAGINFFHEDSELWQVGLRLAKKPATPDALVREILKAKISTPLALFDRYERESESDESDEPAPRPFRDERRDMKTYYRKLLASSLDLELQWGEPDF